MARILKMLKPYIKFKVKQVDIMIKCGQLLQRKLSENNLKKIAVYIYELQKANYATRRKKTLSEICQALGLTP
ncbi:MAG: hypothetical protein KatS3mg096_151 [Candidatus Parcubacteria bacterium]|nr:MAG: hypothetical protein KatS3mg096_151 [Candidatus Parcubacteria bacterium]